MNLSPALKRAYTEEHCSAREAQARAEWIAWGPVVFQASRLLVTTGMLQSLSDAGDDGLTRQQLCESSGLSDYAVKCLLDAALTIGTVLTDAEGEHFRMSKTGWFLLNDPATRVNLDFNHDVNYEGWFHLEEALREGRPAGLSHFGSWPTVYEALSELPEQVQRSWFAFDHFYSDAAFPVALKVVFDGGTAPRTLYDVGGNTGKWALACVGHNSDVRVTVLDLPQQIGMMQKNIEGRDGASRISGYGINLLDESAAFPTIADGPDVIWMSQFLDCFSMEQIVGILCRARKAMTSTSRIYIMETLWDRQRFDTAAFCLTMTSLYFTAIANGNSKMYSTDDLTQCINEAGLQVEAIHDNIGQGHSIVVCKKKEE